MREESTLPWGKLDDKILHISMAYKSIKKWPEGERPRERLLRYGPVSMSDAQLLAIVLRTGDGGKSALDLGLEVLNMFGSLKDIEQASTAELRKVKGIGLAKIAQLKAALELGNRMFAEPTGKGPVFLSSKDVHSYFYPKFRNFKKEVFCCAMLDAKNRMIRDSRISEGTLTRSLIHQREAFREAIKESACSVIFVHNHPSGDPEPSREDISITEKLVSAGDIVGIKVLDHVVVGDGVYASIMEGGYLKKNKV
jgi:DNA repair protein RadC